jgi:hypothetical protein
MTVVREMKDRLKSNFREKDVRVFYSERNDVRL